MNDHQFLAIERLSHVSQSEKIPKDTLETINAEIGHVINTTKGGAAATVGEGDDTSVVDFGYQNPEEAVVGDNHEETPKLNVNSDWMRRLVLMTITKRVNVRYCSKCLMIKPARCHHCRLCNRCVLKMDHHCPWIANCVGFNNHKYFMNMLLYSSLILIFVSCTYSECVADTLFDREVRNPLSDWLMLMILDRKNQK